MKKEQQIAHIEHMSNRIDRILSLHDKDEASSYRINIADVYEACLVAESFFPRRPASFRKVIATTLRKEVCSYCPSKIKPKAMKEYVRKAKSHLRNYSAILKEYIENNTEEQKIIKSVHDLDSTI